MGLPSKSHRSALLGALLALTLGGAAHASEPDRSQVATGGADARLTTKGAALAKTVANAIRADGHPDWFVLTGLVHDLGKVLCSFGEPQWAVVGDTFPVGCAFSDRIVYPELFAANPDRREPRYANEAGQYDDVLAFLRKHGK